MSRSKNDGGGRKTGSGRRGRATSHARSGARQTSVAKPERDYAVGYYKPPVGTRFKHGVSGNPRGRPRGSKNLKTITRGILFRQVKVRLGGRVRSITVFEAALMKQAENALKGSEKALMTIIRVGHFFGLQDDVNTGQESLLSSAEEALIQDLLGRYGKSTKRHTDDDNA